MDWKLFERICNAPGVSGHEEAAQEIVAEVLGPCCDQVRRDRMGNVIGLKKAARRERKGSRPTRVVLAAHVDEIGLMVKHIDEQGFVAFQPVGGLYAQVLVSQRVLIHGRKPVCGAIVPNVKDINDKVPALADLRIDTGLPRKRLMELVEVGDSVTLDSSVGRLNEKTCVGRNFDNRVGVYCMLDAIRRAGPLAVDAYAIGTVQEEVGVRGMGPAAFAVEPDLALAIDGSLCQGPYGDEKERLCVLGEGTGIYLIDGLTIGDRRLVRFLGDLCKRKRIPWQKNIGGGTDASALQKSRYGALVTTVGAPVRYMHSTVQICHEDDIEATVRLLTAFLEHAQELEIDPA
ncbi:MAG TPA: M42 family peptidase [Planctomycetota bacterium]|jgi:endoglucanase